MRTAFLIVFLLSTALAASAQTGVSGVVTDSTGGVVSGAAVVARAPNGAEQQAVTGPDGRFSFGSVPAGATIIVRASGFAEKSQPVSASGALEIVLVPAAFFERVSVTPTRTEQRLGDVPASVSVVDKERSGSRRPWSPTTCSGRCRHSACSGAPAACRRIRRRRACRCAASARAASAARSCCIDGMPFNDPFGGWVYWTRVPLESVDRIEWSTGASSSIYGNYAMGGVINV